MPESETFVQVSLDGAEARLLRPPVLIGRDPASHVRMQDSDDHSRTHAIVRLSGGELVLVGLRGELALKSGPGPDDWRFFREHVLQVGQLWRVGQHSLHVVDLNIAGGEPLTRPDQVDPEGKVIYTVQAEYVLCQTRHTEVLIRRGSTHGQLLKALLEESSHQLSAEALKFRVVAERDEPARIDKEFDRLDKQISDLNKELYKLRGKKLISRAKLQVRLEWKNEDRLR
jgi:hypothetical protein